MSDFLLEVRYLLNNMAAIMKCYADVEMKISSWKKL